MDMLTHQKWDQRVQDASSTENYILANPGNYVAYKESTGVVFPFFIYIYFGGTGLEMQVGHDLALI